MQISKKSIYLNKNILILVMFLLVIGVRFIHAGSIELDFPKETLSDTEFKVNIKIIDFADGVYDLKIDIVNEAGERISRILNNGVWKSTNYYVLKTILNNEEKEFSIKILGYAGSAN